MRTILSILLLIPISLFGAASFPDSLNLETAVALAQKHNPGIQRIVQQAVEQDGIIKELYAARKPKINVIGNGSEIDDARVQSFGDFSPESTTWDLTAEARMTVFSGGRSLRAIEARRKQRASIDEQLEAAMQTLIADVHDAYLSAQLANEKILVQEEVIRVLGEQLKFTQNRLTAGVGEPFDVKQAKVAVANARPDLIRAQNDYRRKIDALRQLTGLPFSRGLDARDVSLVPHDLVSDLPLSLEEATENAMNNRPELAQLDRSIEAMKLQIETVAREQRPLVDVFADYSVKNDEFSDADYLHGWRTGLQ